MRDKSASHGGDCAERFRHSWGDITNKKKTASFFQVPFESNGTPDRVWLVIDEGARCWAPSDSDFPPAT